MARDQEAVGGCRVPAPQGLGERRESPRMGEEEVRELLDRGRCHLAAVADTADARQLPGGVAAPGRRRERGLQRLDEQQVGRIVGVGGGDILEMERAHGTQLGLDVLPGDAPTAPDQVLGAVRGVATGARIVGRHEVRHDETDHGPVPGAPQRAATVARADGHSGRLAVEVSHRSVCGLDGQIGERRSARAAVPGPYLLARLHGGPRGRRAHGVSRCVDP